MKCTQIQRIVLEYDETELTDEILSHLETCVGCGEHFRRACSCRRLVALKRYEIPAELRREACLSELHDRLVYVQAQRDEVSYAAHPAFRFSIAAAVIAMVAAHMVAMNGARPLRSAITQTDLRPYRTFEQFISERNSMITGNLVGRELFETFPTFSTNAPPVRAKPRPKSVFFIGD